MTALTEAPASVVIEGRLQNATYYSKQGREFTNGSVFIVSFEGNSTNVIVFPPGTSFSAGVHVRLKYVRSPFRAGIYATDFEVE